MCPAAVIICQAAVAATDDQKIKQMLETWAFSRLRHGSAINDMFSDVIEKTENMKSCYCS